MFTKEERLFIWKKVYEEIERLEDGDYICVMLRNIVFKFFSTPKKNRILLWAIFRGGYIQLYTKSVK